MLRRSITLNAVREHGHVFFRTHLSTINEKVARTPLLQERPYPLAEVVRRVVRIRVRYQQSDDEKERALLRGEYKFYTGKKIHLRDCEPADLVAAVSCAAFFGFSDQAQIDRILDQLLSRADELSSLELCQLAQDLPRIGKQRSPHLRTVFRLLCANNAERLRYDLGFEDHLDLMQNAVGLHSPPVFLKALIAITAPRIAEEANFCLMNNNNNPNNNTNNNNKEEADHNNIDDNGNDNDDNHQEESSIITLQHVISTLDALVICSQFVSPNDIASNTTTSIDDADDNRANGGDNENRKFSSSLITSTARRLREVILEACRSDTNMVEDDDRLQFLGDDNNNTNGNNNDNTNFLTKLQEELTPMIIAHSFEQLCQLGVLDVFSARTLREWLLQREQQQFNQNNNNQDEDYYDRQHDNIKKSTPPRLAALETDQLVQLCLRQAQLVDSRNSVSDFTSLVEASTFYLIETVQSLLVSEIGSLIELIAIYLVALVSSSSSSPQNTNVNANDNAAIIELLDNALEHILLLRSSGAGVWPVATIFGLLTSFNMIVNTNTATATEKNQSSNFNNNNLIIRPRPQMNNVVKSLCGSVVTLAPMMDANECCTFLALSASLGKYSLDASISSVARRMATTNLINELTSSQIADLMTIFAPSSSSLENNKRNLGSNEVVRNLLIPALQQREKRRRKEE